MMIYCEQCRNFHEENDLCPKYKEQLKQHPEWFNEMVQTVVPSLAEGGLDTALLHPLTVLTLPLTRSHRPIEQGEKLC